MADVINHEKLARNWFFMAGAVALAFIAFLVCSDELLSNSKHEHELKVKLETLREAQSSLPSRVTDSRQVKAE